MKNYTPGIVLTGMLLSWCIGEPWEKDIPQLEATMNERLVALVKLRQEDIARFESAGYQKSQGCPTIYVKKWPDGVWNRIEVVKIHSVIESQPKNWDHFYIIPTRKAVVWVLEAEGRVKYWYHTKGWTVNIDVDSIDQGELTCEKAPSRSWYYRESWLSEYTSGLAAITEKWKKPS